MTVYLKGKFHVDFSCIESSVVVVNLDSYRQELMHEPTAFSTDPVIIAPNKLKKERLEVCAAV